jgi:hypothetical protein
MEVGGSKPPSCANLVSVSTMLSQEQQKTALEHVLSNVFSLPSVHPIRDALARDGIEGIADFLNLSTNYVEDLQ